jgi:isochorismate synthase EntC
MSRTTLSFRSERCEALDPLQVFAAAGFAPRFYWEQPATQRFRVGIGCVERVKVAGSGRFHAAEAGARELFERIARDNPWPKPIGVYGYADSWLVFGGYLFEAHTTCTSARNTAISGPRVQPVANRTDASSSQTTRSEATAQNPSPGSAKNACSTSALAMSAKNAPTIGMSRNARGAGPCRSPPRSG